MLLKLDPQIFFWVFIPVTIITITINALMKYVNIYLNLKPPVSNTKNSSASDIKGIIESIDPETKTKNTLLRAEVFRRNFMNISERGFKSRKAYFVNGGDNVYPVNKTEENAIPAR